MRKKIVAVDMDDTILHLMRAIHHDHNQKHPDHQIPFEDVVAFDDSMFHPSYSKYDFFKEKGTFLSLEVMDEYMVDEMEKIHQAYDLIIVTSSFADNVEEKWAWIQKHLPFISYQNFCVLSRKDLIEADVLIDDAVHNVKPWVNKGRPALVPSHHWNQELELCEGVTMIYGWHGLKEILDHVLNPIPLGSHS